MQQAAQNTESDALHTFPPAAGASHATGVQKETLPARATAVAARLAGGAHLSDSGTLVAEALALADGALSRVPGLTRKAREAGDSKQTCALPAQADDSSADRGPSASQQQQSKDGAQCMVNTHTGAPLAQMFGDSAGLTPTAPGQHQSKDGGQQEAGAHPGAPSEGCSSPQPPGGSSVDVWRPIAEGPLHSITEVACLHLIPDFLVDIGQVAMTKVLSAPACFMRHSAFRL